MYLNIIKRIEGTGTLAAA